MKCEQILGTILDVAAGLEYPSIALEVHLRACTSCSARFHDLQRTMDLLDEWKCPEPSSRFDSQLPAKIDQARMSAYWWPLLAGPLWGLGLAMLLLGGILTVRYMRHPPENFTPQPQLEIVPGSAVGDLQILEEVENMSGNSDLLDQLAPEQQDVINQP